MTSADFCKASRFLEHGSLELVLSLFDDLTDLPG